MKRSPLKPGAGFKPRTQPMPRTGIFSTTSFARTKASDEKPKRKPMKSRGMHGRPPTVEEQRFMDAIAGLGCIACRKDGRINPWASIHHIDGRTKPGAHFKVLDLCAGHHQDGTGEDKSLIAVHPHKARFEARYGTQYDLLAECIELINSGKPSECESPGRLTENS
jgi:hypothetical protein